MNDDINNYIKNFGELQNYVLPMSMLSEIGKKYNNNYRNSFLNNHSSQNKNSSYRNQKLQNEKQKSIRNKSTNIKSNIQNSNPTSFKLKQSSITFQNKTNKKDIYNNNYPGIKLNKVNDKTKKESSKKNVHETKRLPNNSTITTISKKNNNLINKTSNDIIKNVDNIYKSVLYINNDIKNSKINLPEINTYKRPPSDLNKKNNNISPKEHIFASNKFNYNEDDKRYNKAQVKYKLNKKTNPINLNNPIYSNYNNIKSKKDYNLSSNKNNNNKTNENYNYNNTTNITSNQILNNQILEINKSKKDLENNSNINSHINQINIKSEINAKLNANTNSINIDNINPSNTIKNKINSENINSENIYSNKINSENINSEKINSNKINYEKINSENINSNTIDSNQTILDNLNPNKIKSDNINLNINSNNNDINNKINQEINNPIKIEEKTSSLIISRSQTPSSINTTTLNIVSSLIGLNNLGNTCFMNTCLQNLIHCKPLIKELLKIKNEVFTKKISSSFLNLCLNISKTQKSFSPNDFRNTFCLKHYQYANYGQHDTVELLRTLLDDISKELNTIKIIPKYYELKTENKSKEIQNNEYHNWYLTRENSIIISIFYAQIINTFTCECGYKSFSFEKILDIPLLLPNNKYSDNLNLINLLNNYLSGEKFKWDSKCEKCKEKNLYHQKSIQFAKLPKILVFSIQRYNYLSYGKSNKSVSFNDEIDLSNFIDKDLVKQKNTKYKLFGVSNHSGTLDFGHYYSYTKVNNKWYEFNDSSVYQRSISYNSSNVYALFYELID